MHKVICMLIGMGLSSFALGGGSATAAPAIKPALAADNSVIASHYRGRGHYYGRSYGRGYYGRSYGRGYYGHGYYGRSYGRGYYGRHY